VGKGNCPVHLVREEELKLNGKNVRCQGKGRVTRYSPRCWERGQIEDAYLLNGENAITRDEARSRKSQMIFRGENGLKRRSLLLGGEGFIRKVYSNRPRNVRQHKRLNPEEPAPPTDNRGEAD